MPSRSSGPGLATTSAPLVENGLDIDHGGGNRQRRDHPDRADLALQQERHRQRDDYPSTPTDEAKAETTAPM